MSEFPEYELAGIETIARGICIQNGNVLLCKAKGGSSTYLPGGHIEFGETAAQALIREINEEMGVDATTGRLIGVVENSFLQHGKPHAEINLVHVLNLPKGVAAQAKEDWIDFEWWPVERLGEANLLPAEMGRIVGELAGRSPAISTRRPDRALSREEALAILDRVETATVSLVTEDGPYGFPISPVCINGKLYFHSAMEGRKVEALQRDARVWISAFTDVQAATDKFTTYFESAMAWGILEHVENPAEVRMALKALCEKFTPTNMPDFDHALARSLSRTAVYALKLDNVSGKAKRRAR